MFRLLRPAAIRGRGFDHLCGALETDPELLMAGPNRMRELRTSAGCGGAEPLVRTPEYPRLRQVHVRGDKPDGSVTHTLGWRPGHAVDLDPSSAVDRLIERAPHALHVDRFAPRGAQDDGRFRVRSLPPLPASWLDEPPTDEDSRQHLKRYAPPPLRVDRMGGGRLRSIHAARRSMFHVKHRPRERQ